MTAILVSGNINIETTVRVDGFPIPYQPTSFAFFGIGSRVSAVGYNLARALTTLGDDVRLVSVTGRDAAAATIRTALAADRIDDRFVLGLTEQSPQSVVLYDGDGRRHVFTDLKDVLDQAYPEAQFLRATEGCDTVVLTNIAYNRPLLALAKAHGKRIATDVHVIAQLDDAYNQPFMHAADILFMSGERLPEPPEIWTQRIIERYNPEILVVGLGARGALLARPGVEPLLVPAVTTRAVVSTGGAGDALFASFLHGYLRSPDAERALRRAAVFASYKIGAPSSSEGFLTHDELEQLCVDTLGM